jgi:hypothetical protein
MTLDKLQRILTALAQNTGRIPHGFIGCTSGGEVRLDFAGQLTEEQHQYLLRKEFIQALDGQYIYRPRSK